MKKGGGLKAIALAILLTRGITGCGGGPTGSQPPPPPSDSCGALGCLCHLDDGKLASSFDWRAEARDSWQFSGDAPCPQGAACGIDMRTAGAWSGVCAP
jgi:hypothetical protein